MATKQVAVKIQAEGGGQLKAEFTAIGDAAERSFDRVRRAGVQGGTGLQNVGFQIQDFAVQVGAGTSAAQALGQQLPQLLSGFGLFGVVLGTVAAILIPFGGYLLGAGEEAESLAEQLDGVTENIATAAKAADLAREPLEKLRLKYGELAEAVREARVQQAEFARADAARSLASALASTGFQGNDPDGLQALAGLRVDFRAPSAELQRLAGLAKEAQFQVDEIARSYQLTRDQALGLALASERVAESASGSAAEQVAAATALRDYLVEIYGSADAANEATGGLVENLNTSIVAASDLASIDLAGPIGAGADEAGRLATNLDLARQASLNYGKILNTGASGPDAARRSVLGLNAPGIPVGEIAGGAGGVYKPPPAAGRSGGGVSSAEREAARIYDQTRTAAERYKIELEEINALHASGHLDTDTYNRAIEDLGKDLQKTGDLGQKAAAAIRGAFDNLFDDPAAALRNLAAELAKMALYQQLATSLPSLFGSSGIIPLLNAKGNAFDRGVVQAFAAGGIVSSATMFPMRNGMGVMGEAGPEAIMPLTRVGGKLGVAAAGGGGSSVQVNVNNYGSNEVTTSERRGPDGQRIIDVAVGKSLGSGRQDKALKSRFGSRPERVVR